MKTYIIAEIGINHNGSIDDAKKSIDIAQFSGCDAVKFQKRNPDVCVPEHQKSVMRETPWGEMTYLDYKHKIEFNGEYDEIDDYCSQRDIAWTSSIWDLDSLEFMSQYDIGFIKIPSALITDLELIQATTEKYDGKIIVSTGMSTLEEVDNVVAILKKSNNDWAILHCNSSYPAKVDELNLSCIQTLKNRYDCEVGYSGHEFGITTTIASICLGATIIERHITLDRTMWGTDQMCSVEPQGLIKLVRGIRELESAIGDGKKRVTESEKIIKDKLRGM